MGSTSTLGTMGLPGLSGVNDGTLARVASPKPGPEVLDGLMLNPRKITIGSRDWFLISPGVNSFAHTSVFKNGGIVDDIRRLKKFSGDHFWYDKPFGHTIMIGHRYLSLNRVGPFKNYSVKQVVDIIGSNINELFPGGGASGGTGSPLVLGQHLEVTEAGAVNNVHVNYTCDYFFVLETEFLHPLDGILIHGIFRDKTAAGLGDLWMFQEGYGRPMDADKIERILRWTIAMGPSYSIIDQIRDTTVNYDLAIPMWESFAEKTRNFLSTGNPVEEKR